MKQLDFFVGAKRGIRACWSISLAGAIFGFVFGALAHTKDFSNFQATAMSAIVFAGAAQMVALTIWNQHALPVLALMMTSFVICLRFVLMGVCLRPYFEKNSPFIVYPLLFFLVDENWALTVIKAKQGKFSSAYLFAYFVSSGIVFYLFWVVGTLIGTVLVDYIPNIQAYGIDFAFIALFLGLLLSTWRGKQEIFPWIVSLVTAFIAKEFIHGDWYIVIGAVVGSISGAIYEYIRG